VNVGHHRDVLVNERHLRGIGQLALGVIFDRNAFCPHLDRAAAFYIQYIVFFVFHDLFFFDK
jgi:hypothetical protein